MVSSLTGGQKLDGNWNPFQFPAWEKKYPDNGKLLTMGPFSLSSAAMALNF